MNQHFLKLILKSTGASALMESEMIQELWSGYGKIVRFDLENSIHKTIVAKHVHFPNKKNHPRGWNSNHSHKRKVKSYQVELNWYQNWASLTNEKCRVPKCLALTSRKEEVLMILEDLDAVGYMDRRTQVTWNEVEACLTWLANFHATYLGKSPNGLWKVGSYWHLDTRPDELAALDDPQLKKSAHAVDLLLKKAKYQTFVHGDAKLANFCFTPDGNKVAAVDFQYIGGGCGMKDVAYFIGSCYTENECESLESQIMDFYFEALKMALPPDVDSLALEKEWRALYHVAWADFHRFLKGWSPGHWKINSYSERITKAVCNDCEGLLSQQTKLTKSVMQQL